MYGGVMPVGHGARSPKKYLQNTEHFSCKNYLHRFWSKSIYPQVHPVKIIFCSLLIENSQNILRTVSGQYELCKLFLSYISWVEWRILGRHGAMLPHWRNNTNIYGCLRFQILEKKMTKFAASIERPKASVPASVGFALIPWPTGALPQTPVIGLRSTRLPSPPLPNPKNSPFPGPQYSTSRTRLMMCDTSSSDLTSHISDLLQGSYGFMPAWVCLSDVHGEIN